MTGVKRLLPTSCMLLCAACALPGAVREVTYAPSFEYVEQDRLHDAMWRMADDVASLDALVRGTPREQVPQQEVVRLLDDVQQAAATLRTPGQSSNHPMLDRNLETFMNDIQMARTAAAREPPDYFLAGSVTGACVHCHAGRSLKH